MTVRLSVTVMAHPRRGARAEELAAAVGAQIVWDQRHDEWDTGSRALADHGAHSTHHLVLQDDAVLTRGFYEHAVAAITQHPDAPISFYLGRRRPPNYQRRVMAATLLADELGAAWISCQDMLHGVAIALPVPHIAPLLHWAEGRREPYDERIGKWYREQRRRVLYTWPSLVDHEDGEPLITRRPDHQPRTRGRVAWRRGTPTTWATSIVEIQ